MQPSTFSDHHSLTLMIGKVCAELQGEGVEIFKERPYGRQVVALLLGTAAVESGLRHRRQIGGGPARGLWQMDPGIDGAQDIFANYLRHRPQMFLRLTKIWLTVPIARPFVPNCAVIANHLEFDDPFACALARLKYRRDAYPIPDGVERQAGYWKRVYNTVLGAGTEDHYMEMWHACQCERLLRDTGWWTT